METLRCTALPLFRITMTSSAWRIRNRVGRRRSGDSHGHGYVREVGHTFVEILVVIAIIAVLVLISIQGFAKYKKHAAKVQCISKMRAVHSGLANYYVDKGYWPQPTIPFDQITEENYFEWWIAVIEPYGVGADAWLCPVDVLENKENHTGRASSYIPTPFDSRRHTPYRWNQPWLMERGDLHGKGAHVAMPRGEILTSQEL